MNELLMPTGPIEFGRVRCTSSHAHVLDTLSVLPDFPESMYFPGKIVRFGLYIPHEADTTPPAAPEALAGVVVGGLSPDTTRFIIKSQHTNPNQHDPIRVKSDLLFNHLGDPTLIAEICAFCRDLGVQYPERLFVDTDNRFDQQSHYCEQAPSSKLMHTMTLPYTCSTQPLLVGALHVDRFYRTSSSTKITGQTIFASAHDLFVATQS